MRRGEKSGGQARSLRESWQKAWFTMRGVCFCLRVSDLCGPFTLNKARLTESDNKSLANWKAVRKPCAVQKHRDVIHEDIKLNLWILNVSRSVSRDPALQNDRTFAMRDDATIERSFETMRALCDVFESKMDLKGYAIWDAARRAF